MRPRDVEGLRHLRAEAARAARMIFDFEKAKSNSPEGREALSPQERFNAVWDQLKGNINPEEVLESEMHMLTPTRLVVIGEPGDHNNYSHYGLRFELDNAHAGERSIRAVWEHFRSAAGGVVQEGYYRHVELFSEAYIGQGQSLEGLAGVETSAQAYEEAIVLNYQ